ncbi:MAG: hypothetical protein K8R90_04555 [Candidatus Cloacimonetes bacterium]|nr:hypothetical protein [Candidatus Cloacimonadota bacterium]
MRKYVTGGLIVLLVILEYFLAFIAPGVLVALNIILVGAFLYFKFSKHPLGDDPMVRGGAAVFGLVLLLMLAYVLGFSAVPAETRKDILDSSPIERDMILNATSMLAKVAEIEGNMIDRNLQNMETDPNPILSLRIDDYDYTLFEPIDKEFLSSVRTDILEPAAGDYLSRIGSIDTKDYPTLEQKQALMRDFFAGNKIVSRHLSAISGYVNIVRLIGLLFPLFIIYLLGMAVMYVRGRAHDGKGLSLVRREVVHTIIWAAVLVVLFIITGGAGETPFLGVALLLLGLRLLVQVVFLVMAFTGRKEFASNPLVNALAQLITVFFLFYAIVSFTVVGPTGVNESMVEAMQRLSVFIYILAGFFALGVILVSLSRKFGSVFETPGFRAFWVNVSIGARILLGVAIVAVFASLGMFTDSPGTMVPVYFVFFLLVFGGVLVLTWQKHKRQGVGSGMAGMVRKVFGIVLLVICLLIPVYSMQTLFPGFFARVTEHPQGTVQVTNEDKSVVLTWTLDDMAGVERFNIARGDGKAPSMGDVPMKLNEYEIVPENLVFSIRDDNDTKFERPYYYWIEELRVGEAPVFSDPYTFIAVDATVKNLEDVFEQHDTGYVGITNDSLTIVLNYRTNDLGVTGVNIHRGHTPDALKAIRIENEDGTWRTEVETDDSVVKINADASVAPVPDNQLVFIDNGDMQYGWNYYWIIEAKRAEGEKDVYAPFTYSPLNATDVPVEELALMTLTERFNVGKALLLLIITAAIMFVGGLGVYIINRFRETRLMLAILGYIVLFLVATVPALLMMRVDSSYSSLGVAYYTAVFIALLSWWGIALYTTKAQEHVSS